MIVAITGGTGFIGHKLGQYHLERGDQVRVLSRRSVADGENSAINWFPGDLAGIDRLESFVDGADILYHCAGEIRDESRMKRVHVEGTQRLIQAATGRIGRWVQLSSVGAYGRRLAGTVTEDTELAPLGTYEVSKVESDRLVTAAAEYGAFESVILRPSNVFGAEMSNRSLFGLIEMIRCGWFFFVGPPGASANYIHVGNVVESLVLCGAKANAVGQVYNLSDHRTMEQFVAAISSSMGKTAPRLRLPKDVVSVLASLFGVLPGFPLSQARVDALSGRAVYLPDKIEKDLGYRHVVSMEAGLAELTQACLRQQD